MMTKTRSETLLSTKFSPRFSKKYYNTFFQNNQVTFAIISWIAIRGRGLSEGTIDEYRSHYQALGAHIAKENLPEVDGQTPFDFLAARYNLHIAGFHVKKLGSIANSHIRPLVGMVKVGAVLFRMKKDLGSVPPCSGRDAP